MSVYRGLETAYQEDLADIEDDIRAFDAETQEMLDYAASVHNAHREELTEAQRAEEKRLIEEWQSLKRARKYNHASNDVIVKRMQLNYFLRTGEYRDAELCAADLRASEERDSTGAMESMRDDFRSAKRLMTAKHKARTRQLEESLDTEHGVVATRRKEKRVILENVEHKIQVDGERHSDPEKAWNLTRPSRMNEISKKFQPHHIVIPSGNREAVRARGRFEGQVSPLKLPDLDFSRL
jgi:hypothetical protein